MVMVPVAPYLEELYEAMRQRDGARVRDLLARARASWIPRAVREEALAIVQLPPRGHRAPVELFLYLHRVGQLGGDPAAGVDARVRFATPAGESGGAGPDASPVRDPDQLDLPLDLDAFVIAGV